MTVFNGVIETATGYLLRAGASTFVAGAGESLRADVPEPLDAKHDGEATVQQWTGTIWQLVPQPAEDPAAISDAVVRQVFASTAALGGAAGADVISSEFYALPGDGGLLVTARMPIGSFGVRVDAEAVDRATLTISGASVRADISDLSTGSHLLRLVGLAAGPPSPQPNQIDLVEAYVLGNGSRPI